MSADRKPFLLRLDPQLMKALQRWAADDLRSVNAQVEFLLRSELVRAGRLKDPATRPGGAASPKTGASDG